MRIFNLYLQLKQRFLDRLFRRQEVARPKDHTGPEHPLTVYLPWGGRLFLVQWWTRREQYHVLLTKSEEKAISVASQLFAANPDSRVRAYWEIELFAPPAKLCEDATKKVRADDVRDFLRNISFFLFDLEEAGKPLPALFVKCDHYQTPYQHEGGAGEYATKEHWDCINCIGSFRLANMTGDEFYDRYYQGWQAAHPVKQHYISKYVSKNPEPKYSQAPVADDVTDLWMATPDFGHHQPGVDLVQLDPNTTYIKSVLFYFKIIRQLDTTPLQNIIDTLNLTKKERDVQRSLALKQEREQEKQREIAQTLAFFS